jgi:hypothetical protein
LQRTFNLNIATRTSQEFEFSMIDQADFSAIGAYVRGHGLQDASMAEQRRAKKLNVNGAGASKGEMAVAKEEDEGEIAKAVREMEDEEDEEEDYDPGSEEDSEGSGSGSESEDDGEGESDGEEKNLVEEELGSEAEDVDEAE